MLILSRREGKRLRVQAPNGESLWVTMGAGCFELCSGLRGADISVDLGGYHVRILHTATSVRADSRMPMRRPGIGIEADRAVQVWREELVPVAVEVPA